MRSIFFAAGYITMEDSDRGVGRLAPVVGLKTPSNGSTIIIVPDPHREPEAVNTESDGQEQPTG